MEEVKGPRSIRFRLEIWETTVVFQVISQQFIVPTEAVIAKDYPEEEICTCFFPHGHVYSGMSSSGFENNDDIHVFINGWQESGPPSVSLHYCKTPEEARCFKTYILRQLYSAFVCEWGCESKIDTNAEYFVFDNDEWQCHRRDLLRQKKEAEGE